MARGTLITLEGTEGAGKSTQVRLLVERLRTLGRNVRAVREPGGTEVGEEIREIVKRTGVSRQLSAETEMLLMNASRAQLVREVIGPALEAEEIVVCDRYVDSTTAYQGHGRGLDLDFLERMNRWVAGNAWPDLTLWLDVAAELSASRVERRRSSPGGKGDRMEEAGEAFFVRVRQGFAELEGRDPQRVRRIDGGGTVDEVAVKVWQAVLAAFPGWASGKIS